MRLCVVFSLLGFSPNCVIDLVICDNLTILDIFDSEHLRSKSMIDWFLLFAIPEKNAADIAQANADNNSSYY